MKEEMIHVYFDFFTNLFWAWITGRVWSLSHDFCWQQLYVPMGTHILTCPNLPLLFMSSALFTWIFSSFLWSIFTQKLRAQPIFLSQLRIHIFKYIKLQTKYDGRRHLDRPWGDNVTLKTIFSKYFLQWSCEGKMAQWASLVTNSGKPLLNSNPK